PLPGLRLPICGHAKTEDRKVYGRKSGEAPLPTRWCGNNSRRDAGLLHGPKPAHEQDQESRFVGICRLVSLPQKGGRPREPRLPSPLNCWLGGPSKFRYTSAPTPTASLMQRTTYSI